MGPRTPEPGELVYLLDNEGPECVGTVERVEGCYGPDTSAGAAER